MTGAAARLCVPGDLTTLVRDAQGDLLPGYQEYQILDCVGKVKKTMHIRLEQGEEYTTHRFIASSPLAYRVTVQSAEEHKIVIEVKGGTRPCWCTDSSKSWLTLYVCTFQPSRGS